MVVGFASALAAPHLDSCLWGVQRGAAPLRCYLSPNEWGIPHLDSRLRGNDRTGDRPRQNGFFALCVRNSLESLFDKEGLREFGGSGG